MMLVSKCKRCGEKFETPVTYRKFCSNACRQKNYRVNVRATIQAARKIVETFEKAKVAV